MHPSAGMRECFAACNDSGHFSTYLLNIFMRHRLLYLLLAATAPAVLGCGWLPEIAHQPIVRNPFPQLSRVAVAPFINLSDEPTVDGNQFAVAYYNELQAMQGFEVVPVAVVDTVMRQHNIQLHDLQGREARRLAQVLGVDAVVVGAVTEYSPYYPPRCGLRVEWYTANPCFHPIPPGYGLPWGTPAEEFIPEPLVYEAEMALARAQLATQTPEYEALPEALPTPPRTQPRLLTPPEQGKLSSPKSWHEGPPVPEKTEAGGSEKSNVPKRPREDKLALAAYDAATGQFAATGRSAATEMPGAPGMILPPGWPDARGFHPPGPKPYRPACIPTGKPVLEHTRIFHGNDPHFTEALASYEHFRDDARFGGWEAYLQRSEDFIRFCCHLHISEMLSARGGAGKTQVVWSWSAVR